MAVIIGIAAFLIIGGLVLRFSKKFKIPVWKSVICFICWIIGPIIIGVFKLSPVYYIGVIFLPFLVILALRILGKILHWILGGWSD